MSVPGWHGPGLVHGESTVRMIVPSLTALVLSCPVILGTFFVGILGIRRAGQPVLLAGGDGVASTSPGWPWRSPTGHPALTTPSGSMWCRSTPGVSIRPLRRILAHTMPVSATRPGGRPR